jgi:hypothetical protein
MVIEMFNKALQGRVPSLGEIDSEYNTIASELAWEFRDRGEGDNAFFKAIAFMRDHALDVHAIEIDCVGLEALAEQYAIDNERRRPVEKSRLDHDGYDLAALANFVPYCGGAISDGNAVAVVRRAYKKLRKTPPALFTYRELDAFTEFLETLPPPEPKTEPESEIQRSVGRVLFTVPREGNELIQREPMFAVGRIERELLPFGGLKVSSGPDVSWAELFVVLEPSAEEMGSGGETILYGGQSTATGAHIAFSVRVPFGIFNVIRDEIERAFSSAIAKNPEEIERVAEATERPV